MCRRPPQAGSKCLHVLSKELRSRIPCGPAVDRPLTTENQTEHETDPERGKDRLRRVLADVLLAVVLKTADTMERIIPYFFPRDRDIHRPLRLRPSRDLRPLCARASRHASAFSRLRWNRRALIHLIFVIIEFPISLSVSFRCRCFADGADIFSAGSFENVLRPINVFAFIRMNGD